MTTAQDGGKVVSLTHRPPLPPGNAPGTHFCYLFIDVPFILISLKRFTSHLISDICVLVIWRSVCFFNQNQNAERQDIWESQDIPHAKEFMKATNSLNHGCFWGL